MRKVKSAVRTVELLEFLAARHDDPARLREISHALDMPRSSAHALLRTLVAQGWVRSDATGTLYAIGVRALLVGTSYLDSDPYLPLITPFLDDLRVGPRRDLPRRPPRRHRHRLPRDAGVQAVRPHVEPRRPATARLCHRARKVASRGAIRSRPRRVRPGGADAVDRQDDRRPHRLSTRNLDDVRIRGYATDDEENTTGLRCFAVALRYCQPAQDAISASVPLDRLTPQREREIADALRTMGDKVSRVVRPLANGDRWFATRVSGD